MNQKQKFQYNNEFLDKLVVGILTDQKFMLKCLDLQMSQYIDSEPHQWFVKFITNFYKEYKIAPNMESIKIKVEQKKQLLLKQELTTTYINIINAFQDQNIGFIKDTAINFCRFQQLKKAIMKSIDLLKQQSYQSIYDLINKTRFKGIQSNLGSQYVQGYQRRHTKQTQKWIETPWAVINNALHGGLRMSKFGIVLAPPGVGKSWVLINLAAHALKQGKKVIYYTLQMTQDEIGCRMDSKLTGKPVQYLDLPSNFQKMKGIIQPYRNNLRIKQFLPNQTKLSQIQNHFTQLELFQGFEADLIVIDYADIIKRQGSGDNMYASYSDIYVGIKSLAKQYKKAIWSASQGNRGSISSELVLGDNVAHSMGKLQIADFLLSMSRKIQDKMSNTARFVVVKNRGGKDGMVYNGIVDLDIGQIQMYDTFTQKSVQTRQKMDGNDAVMKQRVRQRLMALQKNKQEKGE